MRIAIVTNCTSSSSIPVIPYLDGVTMPQNCSHSSAAQEWHIRLLKALLGAEGLAPAGAMYTGSSFRSILQVVDQLQEHKPQLFVASLGFGLVKAEEVIASYNLNMQLPEESPSSLLNIVTAESFEPIRWWGTINQVLNKPDPIAGLIKSKEYDLVIIALTNNFLSLVSADIASAVQTEAFDNVRIIGPKGANFLQKYLRHIHRRGVIMPYSKTLNDIIPGNRNDFAQRAVLHYIKNVLSPRNYQLNLQEEKNHITTLMQISNLVLTNFIKDEQLQEWVTMIKEQGETSMVQAYNKILTLACGIKVPFRKFQSLWAPQLQEEIESTDQKDLSETSSSDESKELDDALAAMETIEITSSNDDPTEAINALKLFAKAFRAHNGEGTFNVKDVFNWGQAYFARRAIPAPDHFSSANKLGRLLSTISDELDLLKLTNSAGGKSYRLTPN